MLQSKDNTLTLDDMIKANHPMLNAQAIKQILTNATITARYYYADTWYIAKTNSFKSGEIEGENNAGTYDEGKWSVNEDDHTLSVEWNGYWETWTAAGYKVNDEYMFFDTDTGRWRITFIVVEKGIFPTDV